MKLREKILMGVSAIGTLFPAIFYVLFRQARGERVAIEKENQKSEDALHSYVEQKKENEEKKSDLFNDGIDGVDAAIKLMQDSAQKGQIRNSR